MGKSLEGKNLGKGFSQRSDGRYQGRFTKKNKSRGCLYDTNITRLRNAVKKAREKDEEDFIREQGEYEQKKDDENTFYNLFEKWIKNFQRRKVSTETIGSYYANYNNHLVEFGDELICSYTVDICLSKINYILDEYSYNAASVCLAMMNGVFKYAMINQLIQFNPASPIELKYVRKKKVEHLELEDELTLLNEFDDEVYKDISLLAIHTGLRVGEICGLSDDEIDLEDNIIHLTHQLKYLPVDGKCTYYFAAPKYDSKRDLPMDDIARQIIVKYAYAKRPRALDKRFAKLLFIRESGNPYELKNINAYVSRRVEQIHSSQDKHMACNRVSMHVFRHTFATRCLEAGMNTRVIQYLLGHKNDNITKDYAHMTKKKIDIDFSLIQNYYKEQNDLEIKNGVQLV